ncbi:MULTISPECIES: PepSY domain-containing protein [unclassified Cryobacterium]|uniref:PepSY domain-containing protein n=1 Tax=unclassified Cryobacterium TaxID=2649013 RepID=UPI000CE54A41|nr:MULTISPECIES: PepSY domain-containing protein [unclassified Cryobacterium]
MNKKNILIATAAGVVLLLGGAGIAIAVSDNDNDGPLTGETLDRASNAALAEVGPGTVTNADRNDDGGSAYDLEVRLDDGTTVNVELNNAFDVVWVGDYDTDDTNTSSNNSSDDSGSSSSSASPSSTSSATADTSSADQAASDRASAEAAALAAVGSGRVTDFDRDDDWNHLYEVEVTLDNGTDRDVDLDANFVVVSIDDVLQ